MNVDRILQWCVYADYPLFRSHADQYRDKVKKIIIYPSRHHGVLDLEQFAKESFPETWVAPVSIDYGKEDWRQAETMPCLKYSDAEWLWFTEQDFFVKDWDKFYYDIEQAMQHSDMIGWYNPTHFPYIHPSCLFIKREIFEKTKKDFRAHSEINGADHFSMLTKDVTDLGGKITTLQDLGYTDWQDAFHLGGLTYVYQDWKGDGTDAFGVRSLDAFYAYNYWMQGAGVVQSKEFIELSVKIAEQMTKQFPNIDPIQAIEKWRPFFT